MYSLRELVINGDFGSADGWVMDAGWTVDTSGNEADFIAGDNDTIYQDIGAVEGQPYRVTFTIQKDAGFGKVRAKIGGRSGIRRAVNGTYTEDIICADTDSFVLFEGTSTLPSVTLSITNVSVISLVEDVLATSTRLHTARGI